MRKVLEFLQRLIDQERWFLYAALTAPVAWIVALGIGLPFVLLAQPEALLERSGWLRILSGLALAPIIENLVMIAMINVARNFYSARTSVLIMVGVMALIHALAAS